MIVFSGELDKNSKQYVKNKLLKFTAKISIMILLVLSIPIILLSLLWEKLILLFLIVVVLISISFFMGGNKQIQFGIPKKILIDEYYVNLEGENIYQKKSINTVKKVIDFGDWYHIVFKFPAKSIYCVCQKNLLEEGTIEEFEAVFEGKIVRKK